MCVVSLLLILLVDRLFANTAKILATHEKGEDVDKKLLLDVAGTLCIVSARIPFSTSTLVKYSARLHNTRDRFIDDGKSVQINNY